MLAIMAKIVLIQFLNLLSIIICRATALLIIINGVMRFYYFYTILYKLFDSALWWYNKLSILYMPYMEKICQESSVKLT